MNRHPMLRALCAIAFTAVVAMPVFGDSIAYTDLGPGGSHLVAGFPIAGPSQSLADPFTASIGGTLSQIDLGLHNFLGTNSAVISIYTDTNNNLGTLLFSATITNLPPFVGITSNALASLYPTSGVLVKGNNYFLVVAPGAADTEDFWGTNNTGASGIVLLGEGGSYFSIGNNLLNPFDVRVNAAAVAEPSFWLMLGAESFCLGGAACWKRYTRTMQLRFHSTSGAVVVTALD
jgi:hypothetical protein